MKIAVLVGVLAFLFVLTIIVGYFLSKREQKTHGSFLLAGKSLNWQLLSITLALTILGTPHIYGMFEMSWFMGYSSIWFGFACSILLVFVTVFTGKWMRQLNIGSMPEFVHLLFGPKTRLLLTPVAIPLVWAVTTLELQGMGITLSVFTGLSIVKGVIIGGIFGILYISISGLKQMAVLNSVNAVIKYAGLTVGIIFLTINLPADGWSSVSNFFIEQNEPWMLSIWGTPAILISFALSNVLAIVIYHSFGQPLMQPCMAAKDKDTVRKAMWLAVFVNGILCTFSIAMGMAAKSIPEFAAFGPKQAALAMIMSYLPAGALALILAAFFGSMLSSFSATVINAATIFTKDIYIYLSPVDVSVAKEKRVARIAMILFTIAAALIAPILPPIVAALNWLFGWQSPLFVMALIGLFWKRSSKACTITMLAAWAGNIIWSFTSLPHVLGLDIIASSNVYVTLAISLILGFPLTALCEGKPGLFRISKEQLAIESKEAIAA